MWIAVGASQNLTYEAAILTFDGGAPPAAEAGGDRLGQVGEGVNF